MSLVKLTLTVPQDVLEQAKKYAAKKRVSLSQIVSNYFLYLSNKETEQDSVLPDIKKLMGSFKSNGKKTYKELLQEGLTAKQHRK